MSASEMNTSFETVSLTILVDNLAGEECLREHGFALWIEAYGKRILFDTGQGEALIPNAAKRSIDLATADFLVLSHGHYDHTGSVASFLKSNAHCHVYAHPDVLLTRYSIPTPATIKDVSIPLPAKEALRALPGERMHWVTRPTELIPHVWITGSIPREHPLETTGGLFFLDRSGVHPDTLQDDIALWIESDHGLIIVTGCCHSGLMNTIQYISTLSTNVRITTLIGGFHLLHASSERLEATINALQRWKPDIVIPCHCTGDTVVDHMQRIPGRTCIRGYAGLTRSTYGHA